MSNDDTTPAEAEATEQGQTIEHFGKTWHLPAVVRLSHQRALQRNPSNVGIVDAFLPVEEIAALDEINPTADELDKFTDLIVAKLGLGSRGNS